MSDDNNYLGFGFFFLFIVLIVIVGSGLIYYQKNEKLKEKEENVSENSVVENIKIDGEKDYIYFINEESINNNLSITSKYPVINLDSEDAKKVTRELDTYVTKVKDSLKKDENGACSSDSEGILATDFLEFSVYSYEDYITLFLQEATYNCNDGVLPVHKLQAYTFDVKTGELISFSKLLEKYNMNFASMLNLIKNRLNENQSMLNEETPNIKIIDTIDALKEQDTYAIFIDTEGNLAMKYIVKTNSIDYNDIISTEE